MTFTELPIDDDRWLAFVESRGDAQCFHHPAWATAVAATYGFRAFAATVLGADGNVVAGIPFIEVKGFPVRTRWISLPFTDYCPLIGDETALADLMTHLAKLRRDRGLAEIAFHAPAGSHVAHLHEAAVRHVLELDSDPAILLRRFSRASVGRNIRKAERAGVRIRLSRSRADTVSTFFRLHVATRRRQGVPVQPLRFFEQVWEHLIAPGLGYTLVATVGDRAVAAAIFLAWHDTVVYKFGASEPDAWHLRPNNLLFWSAIERSCADGHTTFDWGRTDFDNRGLRDFKRSWGAVEQPLFYSSIGGPVKSPTHGRPAHRLMRTVIRHSPPIVCRATGRALYRFAADRS